MKRNFLALALAAISSPALAAGFASKGEIQSAIGDHTYQGGMLTGAFSEYYSADGAIKGDGYSGTWRATDNGMCFTYGTDPENCWDLKIDGNVVTLFKDGAVDGAGVIVKGNPNSY
ncbi:hypothetical protein HW561_04885 [Rhodobacteraceae bacterium B1Z28]|uniref:MORN repeat protein n=1 Tax=Ruegeria haliotis TaxID=2747601 RepID=A0ABX2PLX6_9RHOB|nr:hypothetical protein [Ruegeria haliotis]NVO55122.1 hypothetical protein [Ruegeria haliotis]